MLDRVRECLRLLSCELLVNLTSGKACLLLQDNDSWAVSIPSAQMVGHMLCPPQLAHGNVTWLDRIWFTMGEICRSKKGVSFTFADALPFTLCISVHHKIVIIRVLYISLKPWHFNEKCHVERSSSPKMCAFKEQDNITVSHFNIFSVTYYGLQDRTQRC